MSDLALSKEDVLRAKSFARRNRVDIELGDACGCYYCKSIFHPTDIVKWVGEFETTATCPNCGHKTVLGIRNVRQAIDEGFLSAMQQAVFPMDLERVHLLSSGNREAIEKSAVCGCFHCLATYEPREVTGWIDEGQTAQCPRCHVDSVLGDESWPAAADRDFLEAMNKHWFQRKA